MAIVVRLSTAIFDVEYGISRVMPFDTHQQLPPQIYSSIHGTPVSVSRKGEAAQTVSAKWIVTQYLSAPLFVTN
jgi:hypothetical protein